MSLFLLLALLQSLGAGALSRDIPERSATLEAVDSRASMASLLQFRRTGGDAERSASRAGALDRMLWWKSEKKPKAKEGQKPEVEEAWTEAAEETSSAEQAEAAQTSAKAEGAFEKAAEKPETAAGAWKDAGNATASLLVLKASGPSMQHLLEKLRWPVNHKQPPRLHWQSKHLPSKKAVLNDLWHPLQLHWQTKHKQKDFPTLEERLDRNGVEAPPPAPTKPEVRNETVNKLCKPEHPDQAACQQEVGEASDACYDRCDVECQGQERCPCYVGCLRDSIPGHLSPQGQGGVVNGSIPSMEEVRAHAVQELCSDSPPNCADEVGAASDKCYHGCVEQCQGGGDCSQIDECFGTCMGSATTGGVPSIEDVRAETVKDLCGESEDPVGCEGLVGPASDQCYHECAGTCGSATECPCFEECVEVAVMEGMTG